MIQSKRNRILTGTIPHKNSFILNKRKTILYQYIQYHYIDKKVIETSSTYPQTVLLIQIESLHLLY